MKCVLIVFLCVNLHIISAFILGKVFQSILNLEKRVLGIPNLEPEVYMNTIEMITHWGFQAEAHNVTTKDGYILEIHRIKTNHNGNKIPILLQHALFCSSADFVNNPRNQSLGFVLADANYDVWLGNHRGNTYGRRHTHLSSKNAEFWRFSWDEMAVYDLPATIDYILDTTGHKQLYYIGHSMGATTGFALLADKPEYNSKIKQVFSLGPVVAMENITQKLLKATFPFYKEALFFADLFGIKAVLSNTAIIKRIAVTLCNFPETSYICADIIAYNVGKDFQGKNVTRLPVYLTHTPAGSSMRTVVHYAQNYIAKQWQHYDWGDKTNFKKYGSIKPPLYDVTKITAPVFIFYGLSDPFADPKDVKWLADRLPNLTESHQVEDKNWDHLDFTWAIKAAPYIYDKIIAFIDKIEN